MGWRDRIAKALIGDQLAEQQQKVEQVTRALYDAYLDGPYQTTPDDLLTQLKEIDSEQLYDVVNQLYWDRLSVVGYGTGDDEENERQRSVRDSRRMWKYDVITQWSIHIWTNYGFGQNIEVTTDDEDAQEVWDDFWSSDDNEAVLGQDSLQFLSERTLVDGEVFLAFFISTLDGKASVRYIDPDEIAEVLTNPDDKQEAWWYRRRFTSSGNGSVSGVRDMWYPDYHLSLSNQLERAKGVLPKGAELAIKESRSTYVCMLHIAHNTKRSLRGWPLTVTSAPWIREHRRFRENRASVAASMAMYIQKLKVQGGQRAVDTMKNKLGSTINYQNMQDTNPPAVAGSTWLENSQANLERLPLATGAGDAKVDGESLLLMAGLGVGLFPHWLGAGDAYRLATATSMEGPLLRQFSRYQLFWGSQFKRMVRIVLWAAEKWGGKSFDDYGASVSTDRLVENDLVGTAGAISQLFTSTLVPTAAAGLIDPEAIVEILSPIWTLALQSIGVDDASEIASVDNLKAPPPPKQPATAQPGQQPPITTTQQQQPGEQPGGPTPEGGSPAAAVQGQPVEEVAKFVPAGQTNLGAEEETVEITDEDIQRAVKHWNVTMPPDFWGLLDPEVIEDVPGGAGAGEGA